MNKQDLVNLLNDLRVPALSGSNCSELFEEKCKQIGDKIGNFEEISANLPHLTKHYFSNPDTLEWKYLLSNVYVLKQIGYILDSSDSTELLSVKEIKTIKLCISRLVDLGIHTKLQPKIPFYISETYTHTDDIFYQYNVLKCIILAFCDFLRSDNLRILVLSDSLRAVLTGLYQIAYCPLKKDFDSVFTEEMYNKLLLEKEMAIKLLIKLQKTIHPSIYIKETMIIFKQNAPPWFKKAISQTLTSILFSPSGLENIAAAILDGAGNDKAHTWKALDVIFKLVASCKSKLAFKQNICQQIVKLLGKTDEESLVFERLFVTCTKNFYIDDKDLSKDVFLRNVIIVLLRFTLKDHTFHESDYSNHISKCLRLLHAIFIEDSMESPCLPVELLKPILDVLFRIYGLTLASTFKSTTSCQAKEILQKYFMEHPKEDNVLFDGFLFGIYYPQGILPFRKDITLEIEGSSIVVKAAQHAVVISASERSEVLLRLLEGDVALLTRFFSYLLRCLVHRDKYFKRVDESLLNLENQAMNEYFETSLAVFHTLSLLAEDKSIQRAIIDSPGEIIVFIKNVLQRTIETNVHKTTEFESEGFQTAFTVTMILNALITNYSNKNLQVFRPLEKPLAAIKAETKHKELADLTEKILSNILMANEMPNSKMHIEESKSELDLILEDICDPLLPVRGHGLMALKKLVEKKDASVMEKKQYVLTIFQQNLKNEDSFIYLNAVDGLAAMANAFSDSVINTLCDEYSEFARKGDDGHEVRIKLGEVLVRVTRGLGEMAPKYKAALLNTFLVGC